MDLCRKKGVLKFTRSDNAIEMLFGPLPADKSRAAEPDPLSRKREHYMNLLSRHVSDEELALLPDGG